MQEPDKSLDIIASRILDGAFVVHRELGPGLLESIYECCLFDILTEYGLKVECQKPMPVKFRNKVLDTGYRIDMVVEGSVIVEIKSLERLIPLHEAQIMTYMKLAKMELGLLLNFNTPLLKNGIKRFYINQNRGDLGVVAV